MAPPRQQKINIVSNLPPEPPAGKANDPPAASSAGSQAQEESIKQKSPLPLSKSQEYLSDLLDGFIKKQEADREAVRAKIKATKEVTQMSILRAIQPLFHDWLEIQVDFQDQRRGHRRLLEAEAKALLDRCTALEGDLKEWKARDEFTGKITNRMACFIVWLEKQVAELKGRIAKAQEPAKKGGGGSKGGTSSQSSAATAASSKKLDTASPSRASGGGGGGSTNKPGGVPRSPGGGSTDKKKKKPADARKKKKKK